MALGSENRLDGHPSVADTVLDNSPGIGQDELLALESFVVGNADLERLEALIARFNIFEALGVVRQELRHSDFLAFLLDPHQSHGMGDIFVKRLLQSVAKAASGNVAGLSPLHIDLMSLDRTVVQREWQRIDILLSDDTNRLAVIIENKVDSSEHSNQLGRYWKVVTRDRPGWRIIGVYLTPDGDLPSDERYVGISYGDVCGLLESVLQSGALILDPDVRIALDHYSQMLRRHIMGESEVAQLCRQIYSKHRAALDLIFEHRPDRQSDLLDVLHAVIGSTDGVILEPGSKQYFHFVPQEWDVPTLNQGVGWLKSGRLLAFSVFNEAQQVSLRLYLGPGDDGVRRDVFNFILAKSPPFSPSRKVLGAKWNLLFQRRLLAPDTYLDLSLDEQVEKLRQEWNRFVQDDLPGLTTAVTTWLTHRELESTP